MPNVSILVYTNTTRIASNTDCIKYAYYQSHSNITQ
ncbi:hypothetical protein BVRB_1g006730 [Beta vulgaris subsp. vulgaris]|nr:hypothetical protein BVRB_1g006730 [Beta vulgaris subsp. vulgaris]